MKKVALVIGASRGIGRQIASTLAENNFRICAAAKTATAQDSADTGLPGDTSSLVNSIRVAGGEAFSLKCDVRSESDIESAVQGCLVRYGRLDFAVYNAGAILWRQVKATPLNRFDLMMQVNVRGAYAMIQSVLPRFLEQQSGKILLVAPPIYSRFFKGKTAYSVSKVGMTILAQGLATELAGTGVSVTTLWPATVIQSHVTDKMDIDPKLMRKPTIFAEACLRIAAASPESINGKTLIDEDYLRSLGVTDFSQYRCVPDSEPPRMMPQRFPTLLVEEENQDFSIFYPQSNPSKL